MKKNDFLKTIMTIIATAIVTATVTTLFLYGKTNNKKTSSDILGDALSSDALSSKLESIKTKINDEFIGDVDENTLREYSIKGYVAGLNDIYSEYFTAKEMEDFSADTLGEYVGIGVYITKDIEKNQIVIYGTIKDSPAEEAGILAEDVLTAVNGEECDGDDYSTITEKIKGKAGTKVEIKILRGQEEKTFLIERRKIEINRITSEMLENNIGYIYIETFDGNVAKHFKQAYQELLDKGMNKLIVDIRNNGGGIVDESLDIAEMFTDKGQKLLIETDKNEKEKVTVAKENKTITMPTVLLINQYSASASEILSGILKENTENVTLVGNTTYGKGVIQSLYELNDGSGLKITTNEYFTPNHNKINKIGIEPDVKIDDYMYKGKLDKEQDTQLKKALEILNQ